MGWQKGFRPLSAHGEGGGDEVWHEIRGRFEPFHLGMLIGRPLIGGGGSGMGGLCMAMAGSEHFRRLAEFTGSGYDKGRPVAMCAAWVFVAEPLTRSILCPPSLRSKVLRAFGATIGQNVNIRNDVRIHWPWKLTIGDDSWIGVGSYLLNLEPITIGSDVCISQQAMLCTGSHQADDRAFEYDNGPITVEDGAWVAARATVLRGVTVGRDAIVGATALVTKDVPAGARVLAPRATSRTAVPGMGGAER